MSLSLVTRHNLITYPEVSSRHILWIGFTKVFSAGNWGSFDQLTNRVCNWSTNQLQVGCGRPISRYASWLATDGLTDQTDQPSTSRLRSNLADLNIFCDFLTNSHIADSFNLTSGSGSRLSREAWSCQRCLPLGKKDKMSVDFCQIWYDNHFLLSCNVFHQFLCYLFIYLSCFLIQFNVQFFRFEHHWTQNFRFKPSTGKSTQP